jgi:hypothetical protein
MKGTADSSKKCLSPVVALFLCDGASSPLTGKWGDAGVGKLASCLLNPLACRQKRILAGLSRSAGLNERVPF